jgi:hypothetical protein
VEKRISLVLALSVSFASGVLVGGSAYKPKLAASDVRQETDAAFRDGAYQAKLDFQDRRIPHPAVGRWSSEPARAQFFAGYQQAYNELSEAESSGKLWPSVAELAAAGYRDGMIDGTWHRAASQPFQADQTTNYRSAGMVYAESRADREDYKRYYREGYLNGYRQAYDTPSKSENGNAKN